MTNMNIFPIQRRAFCGGIYVFVCICEPVALVGIHLNESESFFEKRQLGLSGVGAGDGKAVGVF